LAGEGDVSEHHFQILAENFLISDASNIPTGEVRTIDAPLNYQLANSPIEELQDGSDHHFNISATSKAQIRPMLSAWSELSGIKLLVSGDSPGFQFYTGKYLDKP